MKKTLSALILGDKKADGAIINYLKRSSLNAETLIIQDVGAAKRYISEHHCSCIFFDLDPLDDDGILLVKRLRLEGVLVPIIALTDQGDEKKILNLIRSGASDCLIKSRLTPDSLTASIRNAMNIYQAEQLARETQQQLRQKNSLLQQQNRELEAQRRQIERQNLRLLEANRLKTDFLAVVTHEIRTPLNAIMGFSQILKSQSKGPLNDYQVEMVSRIFANGQNLLRLVNDILDMSVIESDRLELEPDAFDLNHLIHETLADLKPLADKKHLQFKTTINLEESEIYNDSRRLKQVLVNLISNAIKFTDRGSINIAVDAFEPQGIEITVEDTGIGITAEQLDQIFEPFYQADQTIKRHHAGTGLGLAIARSLVAMMEGDITVESQVGQGTTFRVSLPRTIADPIAEG
ncbi:MAG: response regulator [Leptolyngbya sp. RL_3_1]|nr:response regulator [Leptolyngbya sp. RL_3_1]